MMTLLMAPVGYSRGDTITIYATWIGILMIAAITLIVAARESRPQR